MKQRFLWNGSEWVEPHIFYANRRVPTRSTLPRPYVISDGIELQSMLDGRMYTSKAALRASYRAGGVEEIGNDTSWTRAEPSEPELPPVEADVKRAIEEVASR